MSDAELPLENVPVRLFACTPSRLLSWVDCPRRYRMTYLDVPRPVAGPPWAHNSVGASIHAALARWWGLPLPRRTPAAGGDLLESGWSAEGFRDDEQSRSWRRHARGLVERYLGGVDPEVEPLGVERTMAARTPALALSGRVDRLDDRDGALVVVDYKTGRRPLSVADVRGSLALALYAVVATRTFRRPCDRVELHHIPTGEVHAWQYTPESIERAVARSEQIAAEIRSATELAAGDPETDAFAPRPGPGCGWCSLRAHCPAGQAAGPAHQSWDGLGEL